MNPLFTFATFHHLQIKVILLVAFLAQRTKVSLLPQLETGRTHGQIANEFRDRCRATTLALETIGTN